jgi:hypothetical protein
METAHEPLRLHKRNLDNGLRTYLHALFESLFYLTELLNMAVVCNSEVMLGQELNNFL